MNAASAAADAALSPDFIAASQSFRAANLFAFAAAYLADCSVVAPIDSIALA